MINRWAKKPAWLDFLRYASHAMVAALLVATVCLLPGCSDPKKPPPRPAGILPAVQLHFAWTTARHQVSIIALPMDLAGTVSVLKLSPPRGPGPLDLRNFTALAQRSAQASIQSPVADQLTGRPQAISDSGSVLLRAAISDAGGARTFAIPPGSGTIFLRLDLPATVDAGIYHVALAVELAGTWKQSPPPIPANLDITVSDITLPMEPPTLAIATCTVEQLAQFHKSTFGVMQGQYLDRGDPDAARPVAQVDALMQAAHALGICFYVEDLMPAVNVDEVGRVLIDWEAYDRTMGPYLDGTGFADRTGYAAWLVPVPPRRVRDVPTQLRQYWQGCLEHAKDRGWPAAPVLLHPALQNPAANPEATSAALGVVRDAISKEVLVVAAPELDLPQKKIWTTQDGNPRLPPVGAYATPESVRIWPWMAKARKLSGFLWPNCIGTASGNAGERVALLIPTEPEPPQKGSKVAAPLAAEPQLALRMAWLNSGLNDVAHFALLEKRSDPARAAEVLAAIVGRTGLGDAGPACPDQVWKPGRAAFVCAGWAVGAETWDSLDWRLDQLIVAATPGATVKIAEDAPAYLETKIWLARSHQLLAQLGGYRFGVQPGRDGAVLRFNADLLIENPINLQTPIGLPSPQLPGDFQADAVAEFSIDPYALAAKSLTLQGHLESLHPGQGPLQVLLQEKVGGANVGLAVPVPVFKMRATHEPPKLDAKRKDWPEDLATAAAMPVGLRYLSRPDILSGQLRNDAAPASMHWCYDADFIYALIECPQPAVDDERNNDWPEEAGRWWGADGLQIQLAGGARLGDNARVVEIAIKPSGAVLLRQAALHKGQPVQLSDGPAGVRYSIHADGNGYVAQLAIPRKWFPVDHDQNADVPVWRVNVLRHVKADAGSTSWSGPVRDDADFSMMGLLVGVGE